MKKLILLSLLFCFSVLNSYFLSAQNPIIPDMIADPSIVKINGTYYCYATTDGYGKGLASSGPPVVWQSKDFVNWSFNEFYFPSAKDQLYWAPSKAVAANGKYYLYPTVNTSIYAAVSDSPTGPFKLANGADTFTGAGAPQPLVKIDGSKHTKGIDADVLVDDDGQAYMFWAQRGAARLHKDMVTLDTSVVVIPTKRKGYSEGPIVFKRKGIYYYLYTLEGHENYKYAYIYSKTSPLGPFIFPENDIIAATDRNQKIYGPGHGCVFNEPGTDNYYFSYLEFGIGGTNRQVWVDKLEFNADGTIIPVKLTHPGVGALSKIKQEKNLALGAKVVASSQAPDLKVKPIKDPTLDRTENYLPQNAIDGSNGTRWMAAPGDSLATITLDLGKTTQLKRSDAYFVQPTAGHAYKLEYSADGKTWKACGGHVDVRFQSPHTDNLTLKTRFLRITFLKGTVGLWEWKVY
jgi:Beta-xylosidase